MNKSAGEGEGRGRSEERGQGAGGGKKADGATEQIKASSIARKSPQTN